MMEHLEGTWHVKEVFARLPLPTGKLYLKLGCIEDFGSIDLEIDAGEWVKDRLEQFLNKENPYTILTSDVSSLNGDIRIERNVEGLPLVICNKGIFVLEEKELQKIVRLAQQVI